jgi:hypothetical protein
MAEGVSGKGRVVPRDGCIYPMRDGFGIWPGDDFHQEMCCWEPYRACLPAESESGLMPDVGLPLCCVTRSVSLHRAVRLVAIHFHDRQMGRTKAYAPWQGKENWP